MRAVIDHGALGVVALVLVVTLACVVSGADAALVYALVALVVACTIMIAVAVTLIRKGATEGSRTCEAQELQPTGEEEQ